MHLSFIPNLDNATHLTLCAIVLEGFVFLFSPPLAYPYINAASDNQPVWKRSVKRVQETIQYFGKSSVWFQSAWMTIIAIVKLVVVYIFVISCI